jgi:hypothetical protein
MIRKIDPKVIFSRRYFVQTVEKLRERIIAPIMSLTGRGSQLIYFEKI